ncbi:MAG: hypothetical protein ABI614_09355 [Planctomycetota bacterium]
MIIARLARHKGQRQGSRGGSQDVTSLAPMKFTPDLAPIKDSASFSFVVFGDSQGDKGDKNGELVIAMHYPVYPKEELGGWGLASQLDDDSRGSN